MTTHSHGASGDPPDAPLAPTPHEPEDAGPSERARLSVVGIGASAGGLEAFSRLLRELPADTGMAYVLVPHLSPSHPSLLAEILSRVTPIPVVEVSDEPEVLPDHVYVIPPDRVMYIAGGHLRLGPREPSPARQRPIDEFFRSLAQDVADRAIGVVLAGTGSDGTLGLQEIKARGGITFAQDDSAEFPGMPQSAVSSGCVDVVAAPAEIGRELGRIARLQVAAPCVAAPEGGPGDEGAAGGEDLERILALLRSEGDPDFSRYKRTTLGRRIRRRMVLLHLESYADYLRYLGEHAPEVKSLRNDLLIGVTSFFRNPEEYRYLARHVLPALAGSRSRLEPLRVWCAGCSTGEEAYSVAMTCRELAATSGLAAPFKIFASDVNADSVNRARAGIYSRAIADDLTPERLARHFIEVDQGYRVASSVREQCIFAQHDLLSDPPFSRIDLIVCRNLLIYMDAALQQQVLSVLLHALAPGGVLWLGTSEVLGSFQDQFERLDSPYRFFRKKAATTPERGPRGPAEGAVVPGHGFRRKLPPTVARMPAAAVDAQREADRLLLAKFAPPAVLVNAGLDILHSRGDTSPYLAHGAGEPGLNLLKLARAELLAALRDLVERARAEGVPVRHEGLAFSAGGAEHRVDIEAVPVRGASERPEYVLLSFEAQATAGTARGAEAGARGGAPGGRPATEPREAERDRLTHELAATREYLQSVIEQQLSANQDLQAANEENQSSNEEMQSINEELETSKEEVQAANEELTTVNDELRERNAELASSNADFLNLLASVEISIVMLGPDLRIRRFTPPAERLLNLIPADVGRPIGDIHITLDVPDLQAMLAEVLEAGAVQELTVRTRSGRWHSLRLRPYQTSERRTEGVVMVLVDIDALKRAQDQLRESEERQRLLIDSAAGYAIMMLDAGGAIVSWNAGAQRIFGYDDAEILGQPFARLFTPEDRDASVPRQRLADARQTDGTTHEIWLVRKDGSRFWASGTMTALRDPDGALRGYAKIIRDNTDRKLVEDQLQRHVAELAETDRFRNEFLAMLAHEFRNPLASVRNATEVLGCEGVDPATAARARGLMSRQIGNMAQMIDDLLDVTRVSHGKIQLHKQVIDLAEVLRNACDVHRALLRERSQQLELSLPREPVLVMGDATRLEQVFGNLVHNASKYGHDGGHIRVELEEVASGGDGEPLQHVVRVRDDGIGIEPELLSRVFDLFAQADQSLARDRGGLGIGLTLARRLVELHGGRVEASSAGTGRGSEFTVHLPTVATILRRPQPRTVPRRRESSPARRVLVVDDNPDAAESLAMLLRLAGHDVRVALGSETALALAGERFDVALLDIGLPGMNGLELARELRGRLGAACPVLVALTGYGHEGMKLDVKAAGFTHHLLKPADPQMVLDILAASGQE